MKFIVAIILFLTTAFAGPSLECHYFYKNYSHRLEFKSESISLWGSNSEFLRLPSRQLHEHKIPTAFVNPKNAVFIGIQASGHLYIATENYRHDGNYFHHYPRFLNKSYLSEGIVIRLEDADGSMKTLVDAFLAEHGAFRSLNCVTGGCRVLQASSIVFEKDKMSALVAESFLKKVVRQKIIDGSGRPVITQLFVLGDADVTKMMRRMSLESVATGTVLVLAAGEFAVLSGVPALIKSLF